MKLFDRTLGAIESSLDARLVRQNVLAGNIANIDTPDYRPQNVSFAQAFNDAQQKRQATDGPSAPRPGDLPIGLASTAADAMGPAELGDNGIDGNRVDLDRTMASLAENGLQYGASARSASKKLSILRYVVSDGNG